MIVTSVIGAILCILCIWILKNSRCDDTPVLRIWYALGLGISAIIPVWNLCIGLSILITISLAYLMDEELSWKTSKKGPSKLSIFLNKKIS